MFEYFAVSVLSILLVGVFYKNKGSLALSFLILTVFFAIRYEFGNDYYEYLRHFYLANEGSLRSALDFERFEDGWVILCRLCKPIGFFGMVILLTVFENAVLYHLFRKYIPPKWYWLAILCYLFSTTLCLTGLSMMRQFLAMCICLLAFDLVVRKKIIFSLALVFLAGQFHTSVYACLPVCFIGLLKDFKLTRTVSYVILAVLVSFSYVAVSFFGGTLTNFILTSSFDVYESAFDYQYEQKFGVTTILNFFLFAVILMMLNKQDKPNRLFVLIFLLYQIVDAFKPLAPSIGRVGLYFYILFPICMTNAVIKLDKLWTNIVVAIIIMLKFFSYFSFVGDSGWGSSFSTYTTIFSVDKWM